MNKNEVIEKLQYFRERINGEVFQAYAERGSSFGRERFSAWRRQFTKFLDENLPRESSKLDAKLHHIMLCRGSGESDVEVFWRRDGNPSVSFIDSLIIDIQSAEARRVNAAHKPRLSFPLISMRNP